MLNAIENASESDFVNLFHLCFIVFIFFSLLGTSNIQVGGCDKSGNMTYLHAF
jgi:hypothetical protein